MLLVCREVRMPHGWWRGMVTVRNTSDWGGREPVLPTQQITDGKPPVIESSVPPVIEPSVAPGDEAQLRELAIKQIERKRRFEMRAFTVSVVAVILLVIWAITEYHNAGGWPTNGFSQSSGIHDVWNDWIIYPIAALALGIGIDAWNTYRRKPITESEIKREMERLTGGH